MALDWRGHKPCILCAVIPDCEKLLRTSLGDHYLRNVITKFREKHSTVSEVVMENITTQRNTLSLLEGKGQWKTTIVILNKMHKIYRSYKTYKNSWFSKEKNTSALPDDLSSHLDIIITAEFLSSCCISNSEKTNPPLQHRNIETIKILSKHSPLRWHKCWRSVQNDENTRIIQVNNLK